ncbi:MAG: photosystem II reaction center protein T [Pseudanabaena sp.]|jgi:photosystem II PsbT protein|uniref:Photosystem II reaction center protein T n=1 Tax=Pseudanabaena cinerea FACHB-1277 TaxID=2949581 RepID=A0A926UQZ0_9CYAN|nr:MULTISPECIES: photosystem II reaction center protein T [Pseudanabaena]MCA6502480.1 photosystem II reaction center protein T [Pseudanabaena sp. M090S1SP2A07QC]MCA6507947.1 photosystem II reaction center protein T [Pseudanabaena sp. M172S2SP2A07QC]MCA6510663.1 photosystem II reaction center protein T [Pseudanabaena sp. M109S1SP2A07QC]MCA6519266.1 photosystem II reaction center protein T [Pseudanabaena sp. M110S1SP2A07QC]MCA6528176.1 photosystem II reaction center protein T [Pseudanabaena sp. 
MEALTYTLIFACLIGLFFFAIFFREPPKVITKDKK